MNETTGTCGSFSFSNATKLGLAQCGDAYLPIYRKSGRYYIDMGGSVGVSDPLDYPSDAVALRTLRDSMAYDPWEV